MKNLIIILGIGFLCSITLNAENNEHYRIRKEKDGLYFMYFDSSKSKSTIIEFDEFFVMIDMPISSAGGGVKVLKDYSSEGNLILESFKYYFPNKPLKYILSSHWHPHSISSIIPFISNGITLFTTAKNFDRLSEFVDSTTALKYKNNIVFVENDSIIISDKNNQITAYHCFKKDYENIPTTDFLYFYVKKQNLIHCSCMYPKINGGIVEGKEFIAERSENLNKFLVNNNLHPDYFTLTANYNGDSTVIPYSVLGESIKNGITKIEIVKKYLKVSCNNTIEELDELVKNIFKFNIPVYIINSEVYSCLKKNDLKQALLFAKIQAIVSPQEPNSWDTYGEVYYFMGELAIAKKYEKTSLKLDPKYTFAGEESWKKDLKDFRVNWIK